MAKPNHDTAARMARREVPLDLRPSSFAHRIKLGDDESPDSTLSKAHRAFSRISLALDEIYSREQAIMADTTRTDADRRLRVTRVAESAREPVAEALQAALDQAKADSAAIDDHIEKGLRSRVEAPEAREIRAYLRTLPDAQRDKFLEEADDDVLSAVLSAKPFLSGVSPAKAGMLRERATRSQFPEQIRTRERLSAAQDSLKSGWSLFLAKTDPLLAKDASETESAARAADEAAKPVTFR